jgi:Xaa-Pro dipeptidase
MMLQIQFRQNGLPERVGPRKNLAVQLLFQSARGYGLVFLTDAFLDREMEFCPADLLRKQIPRALFVVAESFRLDLRPDHLHELVQLSAMGQPGQLYLGKLHADLDPAFPAPFFHVEDTDDRIRIVGKLLRAVKEGDPKLIEHSVQGTRKRLGWQATHGGVVRYSGSVVMSPLYSDAVIEESHITAIQQALREANLDGWLFYDFRGSDPLAARILRLDPHRHTTRRWYYLIPAHRVPIKIVHRIEPRSLDDVPGETRLYLSWEEQHRHLREALSTLISSKGKAAPKVSMQYSPLNAIPYVSRVDAGTVELVRSFGVDVVSSADLIQRFEAVWNEAQYQSHCRAATALHEIVTETFAKIRDDLEGGRSVSEYDLQQYILARIASHELYTYAPPIVAVNAHAADTHYTPSGKGSGQVQRGDFVLIDLWAKSTAPRSMYADITWTGFVGDKVPPRHREIFTVVAAGRDAALDFLQQEIADGRFPTGGEVDDVCRRAIGKAGYQDRFIHRTGHSIGDEVHGNGANIDNLETQDGRRLMPHTCFSIEPGVYLPGEFGVRSEIDVYLTDREVRVTSLPVQTAIVPILAS